MVTFRRKACFPSFEYVLSHLLLFDLKKSHLSGHQVILKYFFILRLKWLWKVHIFFIYFKNTNTGMSIHWENQQWDVIRVISGLFPTILGEKVFVSPPQKKKKIKLWFAVRNLFPFQFGGFFVVERNLYLKVDALYWNACLIGKAFFYRNRVSIGNLQSAVTYGRQRCSPFLSKGWFLTEPALLHIPASVVVL